MLYVNKTITSEIIFAILTENSYVITNDTQELSVISTPPNTALRTLLHV